MLGPILAFLYVVIKFFNPNINSKPFFAAKDLGQGWGLLLNLQSILKLPFFLIDLRICFPI